MSRKVFITGVSGFIGRHVAEEALRRGYRVSGIDRKPSQMEGIEFINADIRDKDRLRQIMKGKDCVVHLAAVTSNVEFVAWPVDCYETNANGFLNVVELAAKSGCQRLVYASSAAVYLDDFSEDAVINVAKQGNHYAKSKMMNEMVANSYEDIYGMSTTGLRYFNVYGSGENDKGDYASIVALFLKAKKHRESLVVYGDGTQARDLIHVTDAAAITLDLLEKGSHHVYNVGTGVATAYTAIAEMIDGKNIRYVPNPLPNYQHYTRAETVRLREAVGAYTFTQLAEGIKNFRV